MKLARFFLPVLIRACNDDRRGENKERALGVVSMLRSAMPRRVSTWSMRKGRTIAAADIHRAHLATLHAEFSTVATTDSVVSALA